MKTRIVQDSLGAIAVPENVYYGAQTERARQNFDISSETTDQYADYINAIALIKKAAALAHKELGVLDGEIADAIVQAAEEVRAGRMDGQFPLNVLQGGGGTSSNMNLNEVIACRANEILTGCKGFDRVHPNDHVNMGQSTNDVIPSAVKLMSYTLLGGLAEEADALVRSFRAKEAEFSDVVKLGRTCLQDAMPVTLGQEFSGYAELTARGRDRLAEVQKKCLTIPMGGTAVGTGSGSYEGYPERLVQYLRQSTGLPVRIEENLFDGLQNGDIYLDIMHAVKALAVAVSKIATDFRMLSSGPRAGLNEIILPAVQPGSSIMPGKVNPVMPELINQIAYDICGSDVAVTMAVEGGELDLNVWEPLAVKKIASSIQILTNGMRLFRTKCVDGIRANGEVCRRYAERSVSVSSIIAGMFDYHTGTTAAHWAVDEDKSIREVAVEMGLLTEAEADKYLDPMTMTDNGKMAHLMREFHMSKKDNGEGK